MPLIDWDSFNPSEVFNWDFDSECLTAGAYNPINQTLTLEFNERGTFQYYDVPLTLVIGLMQSSSAGRYFNATIRDAFSYARVG